ncbi:histone PARylation factor 1 isoform X1 [Bombus vosnesenskii]|uniref:Histone PARylation factor 1 isoform X1 n=1 Tax=Bombus vosnesenskii TaxID=207650 RepID=A0A6J3LHM2_9HYME|nr:histone PARylation factor 1 isoform X1 [Bombus vosnesenskii]
MSDKEKEFKAYKEDTRIPCQYGAKCYQKNAIHHQKYKHPPAKETKKGKITKRKMINNKRKQEANDQVSSISPQKKIQKTNDEITDKDLYNAVTSMESNSIKDDDTSCEVTAKLEDSNNTESVENSNDLITIASLLHGGDIKNEKYLKNDEILPLTAKEIISHLFFIEMPEDFFQLYEFCKSICERDPLNALKIVHLQLVGPYDVFRKGFINAKVENKEALLRHWRYYYDPPEFQFSLQTVIKSNTKDGLHFGYWRDDVFEKPVFMAKNKAAVNCIIDPVAENIFGTLDVHFEEKLKLATPFEKTPIAQLRQKLKSFAKERNITLEKRAENMQAREKETVARTFHKAGIVVPYDKKTQLGYRNLAVSNSELQKLIKQIEDAPAPEARKMPMSKLDEVIRLATIAADECDFGTVLELGHDLFSSGAFSVQTKVLNLLSLAYNLLQRSQFLEIVTSHLKNRRRSLDLSVIQFD